MKKYVILFYGDNMDKNFIIINKNNRILALSKFRIPFDLYMLKGERKENILSFRDNLISAIKTLTLNDGDILYGRYGSTDTVNVFYDVENILFYNIGTAVFKDLTQNGISFSSLNKSEIKNILEQYGNEFSCIYEYNLISSNESFGEDSNLIAKWAPNVFCKFKGSKPVDYWKAIRNIDSEITIFDSIDCNNGDAFALDMSVFIPKNTDINIATSMKPFLDGLICAFHGEEKMEQDFSYLIEKVNCKEEWLHNKKMNLLGDRQYLYKYRDNIKWNPADDLCKKVRIKLEVTDETVWKLAGKIYKI